MALESARGYGGYDHKLAGKVPERFVCNICTKVLREPHLTVCCGQHFCESCLENWFKRQGKKSCPHCREENFIHFLNKERKRDVFELKIHCTHHEEGCQWIGELGNVHAHLEKMCSYTDVECPKNQLHVCRGFRFLNCSKMKRKDLQEHLNSKCPQRRYTCVHCGYVDTYQAITTGLPIMCVPSHYDKCPEYPLECPNKCGAEAIKRKDMSTHRHKCPEEPVECPNGCESSEWFFPTQRRHMKMKRKNLPDHLDNDCYLRKYKCEHCHYMDTYEKITGIRDGIKGYRKRHYDTCPDYPLECPNECGAEAIKRKDMSAHRDECPEETVECPNGCHGESTESAGFQMSEVMNLKRKDLPDHLSNECYLRKCKCEHCGRVDTYENITRNVLSLGMSHYDICPEYPLECPNECEAEAIKRKDMSTHRDECPLELMECPFKAEGCKARVVRKDFDNHMSTQILHQMLLMKTKLTQMMRGISKNVDSLLQTCTEDQKLPLQSIRAIIDKSHHLKEEGDTLTIEIPDLSQYKRSREVWRSPPFYVKEGYKVCLAVYPNGIGKGEGTHVSLSLVLMKGEFDDELEWPIRCHLRSCYEKIEVKVMSQQRKTYSYAIFSIDGLDRVHGEVVKTILNTSVRFLKHGTRDEQEMVRGGALAKVSFEVAEYEPMALVEDYDD